MPGIRSNLRRVVILTAIPVEYKAVRAHLTDPREEIHRRGTVYERGTFSSNGQAWTVGIVEVGVGNTNAALEVERAIRHFKTNLIFFVGIAGGLKDVGLGDVVAATKIYAYESGKAMKTFETRPDVGQSTYRLEQRARAEAKKTDWLERIQGTKSVQIPHVFVGPIAAGDRVLASKDSSDWKLLKSQYGDALAVEMEGRGFIHAAHANQQVEALLIRGISDLINDKDIADAANFQEIAARHASAFAFEILAKLDATKVRHSLKMSKEVPVKTLSMQEQQQEDLLDTQEQEEPGKIEPALTDAGSNQLFQDFLSVVPQHYIAVKDICNLFSQRDDIYKDQCDRVIKSLNSLVEPVQRLCRDDVLPGHAGRAVMVNMHSQISALITDLYTFRSFCPPPVIPTYRRQYDSYHKQIRTQFESLMESLELFNVEIKN